MDAKPQRTVYGFIVDHPEAGLLQMHFDSDICSKPRSDYPVCFKAEQVARFNLDEAIYDEWFTPVAMSLVDNLIRDGHTGVDMVVISSRKGIKVIYNPELVQTHLLKSFIRQIIDYADDYGWRPQSLNF